MDDDAEKWTLAERVKRLRERTGLSQFDFADKAGLSREGYQKIERGLSLKPDNDSIRAIAKAAGVRVSSLSRMLGWVPVEESDDAWLRSLTDHQRELVLQIIEVFRAKADDPPQVARRQQRAVRS